MKFICLQQNLKEGLSKVTKAVATRTTMPILSNVYISAESGSLKLAASNMETTIVTWVGAKVEEEGQITIPAKLFSEFINSLREGTVNGQNEGDNLKIVAENAKSTFNGTSADEFPSLPLLQEQSLFKLNPEVFEESVRKVAFASAIDDSRPVLTGVLFSVDKDEAFMVGVDGFRLSEIKFKIENTVESGTKFIVPAKTLIDASKLMVSSNEVVSVALLQDKNQILFQSSEQIVSSRLIDGEFPNYKQIIPNAHKTTAKFTSDDFQNAVKLASIFAKDSAKIIRMAVDTKNQEITIFSNTADIGDNETKFKAEVKGDDLEVAFNSRYVIEMLNNIVTEEFMFESEGSINPCVFKPVGQKDFLHIVMPVRLNG